MLTPDDRSAHSDPRSAEAPRPPFSSGTAPEKTRSSGGTDPATGPTGRITTGPAGPELLASLVALVARPAGLRGLHVFDLVDVIECAERISSQAHSLQLLAIADLYVRPEMDPPPTSPNSDRERRRTGLSREDLTVAEVSAKLTVTSSRAAVLLTTARALAHRLPGTLSALSEGHISGHKAQIIATHITGLADHVHDAAIQEGKSEAEAEAAARAAAALVEDRILGRAPAQMPRALGECLRRATQAVNREYAEARRQAALRNRRVELRTGLPDGMAALHAELPAPEALAIWNVLDKYARALRRHGDQRTLNQLRSDLLVYLVTNAGALAVLDLRITMSGCRPAAEPDNSQSDEKDSAETGSAGDATDGTAPQAGPMTRPAARSRPGTSARIHVTVGLDTLTGASDEPGELAGYGAITAELARAIAFDPDSTWRRLVTDPLSGALLDYGRTTYRAPQPLADHVRARDVTCIHAGCATPAADTDLDHLVPYPIGTTSKDNLACTCRRDHRLKHEGGWQHVPSTDPADPAGTIKTISPTGQVYTRHPFPIGPVRPDSETDEDSPAAESADAEHSEAPEQPGPEAPPF